MNVARRPALAAALASAFLLSACDSGEPAPTAGVLTATLVSPNGPEGAAYLTLFGEGIVEVRALDARTFSHARGDTVNVVVVRDQPGDLRFLMAVADTTRPPGVAILEVAGGDDELRPNVGRYRVEMRP
jgi:acetyl esterase/lipase